MPPLESKPLSRCNDSPDRFRVRDDERIPFDPCKPQKQKDGRAMQRQRPWAAEFLWREEHRALARLRPGCQRGLLAFSG